MLLPLLVAQWLALAVFALLVQRNGWLFYQGGDQTWFYTSGWILGNGAVPETLVGYAWAMLQAPVAALAGPNFLAGLPAIVLFQFFVLAPLGVLLVYGIAARIGGRAVGYGAASLWIVLPYLAEPLFVDRYHERYVEQVLPQVLGLTALGDYPSMIALLAAAFFLVRALDSHGAADAVACGLFAGLAVGIKPANGLFVFAPIAALAIRRRWREIAGFGVALLPALLTLALWKHKGSGISLLAHDTIRIAAGASADDYGPPTFLERVQQYVPLDREQLNQQFLGFREYFWSARLLEFGALAGVIAAFRRSAAHAIFLAVWLGAFFVVKGSSPSVTVETGSFWRLLMPAFPAYFLLLTSIPLLIPVLGAELRERFPIVHRPLAWRRPVVLTSVALAFGLPLLVVAVLPPAKDPDAAKVPLRSLYIPIDNSFRATVTPVEGGVQLEWPAYVGSHANTFYVVYRSPLEYTFPATGRRVSEGLMCSDTAGGATGCSLEMTEVGRGRDPRLFDRVPRGRWTYRVAVAANWLDDADQGDTFVVSAPLNISVG
ncbi:MAG TPA: hypothetical protein VFP31_05760 [Gaiellaceae bacterium]|nr:hypothetical protein [Gaiellaceae bacterium]